MKYILLLILCCSCTSISQEALNLSIETNTALMVKYNKVSSEFRAFLVDMIFQLKEQGKDIGGLNEWVQDLDKDDADVAKIAYAFKVMIDSDIVEKDYSVEKALDMADKIIKLKDKYGE